MTKHIHLIAAYLLQIAAAFTAVYYLMNGQYTEVSTWLLVEISATLSIISEKANK
jgi:hypothetical protein